MADEAASPSKLSPGEEMEEAHYGIEEDNETKEFKVAQEAAAAAEGYDETKAQAQALKELLVRQPEWIKAIAMRLKAEAKRTVAAIEKEEQEQQNHRDSMEALRKELAELKDNSAVAHVEELKEQLEAERATRQTYLDKVEKAEQAGKSNLSNKTPDQKYVAFLCLRGDANVKADLVRAKYEAFQALGVTKAGSHLDHLMAEVRAEEMVLVKLRLDEEKLEEIAKDLKVSKGSWQNELKLEALHESLAAATESLESWKQILTTEIHRRGDLEKKMETLFKEQTSLLSWCTTQQQALKQLTRQEDIIEFCTSLHELVPTMLENMTLVQDMSEPHLPNPLVTASSVDLHNAWVKLQVTSYEMLLKTLMEQHNASPLKEAVVEFAKWQKLGAKQCLDDAEELLKTPEDPNEKELVAEALEMCLTLQNEFQPHLIMCGHLADFDWRMELLEEQYHPMLKTVLSSLTSLCQKIRLGTTVSFKGKAEYESHINDLNDYIAAKDTDTTAWEYAKERTSKIQQLIPRMEAP